MPNSSEPPAVQRNPQLSKVWKELHEQNMDAIIVIAGRRGVGKSCTALYCQLALDVGQTMKNEYGWFSRFSLDKCFWVGTQFIDAMTKQDENLKQFFRKGTCFVFDEVNIEASNLEFQSIKGKAIVTALQTNRKYNYCVLMTTPSYKSMSLGLRRLVTAVIEIKKKIKINGKPFARASFKWVDANNITGADYHKYQRSAVPVPIDRKQDGTPIVVWRRKRYRSILIPLISSKLEAEYNVLKDQSMKRNRDEVMEQLEYYKKYLGESGIKRQSKRYKVEDLKPLFLKPDGSIAWEKFVIDGKPYQDLAMGVISEFDELVPARTGMSVWQWLMRERRMYQKVHPQFANSDQKVHPQFANSD